MDSKLAEHSEHCKIPSPTSTDSHQGETSLSIDAIQVDHCVVMVATQLQHLKTLVYRTALAHLFLRAGLDGRGIHALDAPLGTHRQFDYAYLHNLLAGTYLLWLHKATVAIALKRKYVDASRMKTGCLGCDVHEGAETSYEGGIDMARAEGMIVIKGLAISRCVESH